MLFVVYSVLFDVCCSLRIARCVLFLVSCVLFVVSSSLRLVVDCWCLLCVACYLWYVVSRC